MVFPNVFGQRLSLSLSLSFRGVLLTLFLQFGKCSSGPILIMTAEGTDPWKEKGLSRGHTASQMPS